MNPSTPFVSVVTPCLNAGDRLRRCVESVRAQKYEHLEHLVVDGGSTDGTLDYLRSESRVEWTSERDRGQSDAINKGFRMAKGDLIGWLNADDVLTPEAVASVAEAWSYNQSSGWVYGKCAVEGSTSYVLDPPRDLSEEVMEFRNLVPQPGSFYSREALLKVGPLDESLHLAMDYDLFLRLLREGFRGTYVNSVLAIFELHAESKSASHSEESFMAEELRILSRMGRQTGVADRIGRIAVARSDDGKRVDGSKLKSEVTRLLSDARAWGTDVPFELAMAAAFTDAAMVESQRSIWGVRHLLRPSPWRSRITRRRIGSAVRKRFGRANTEAV